jgi:urease accessory protein
MKIILDVDLSNNSQKDADDEKDVLTIGSGCILIEELPTEQESLGPIDTVSLTWDQRSRPRRRCFTSSGKQLALALPRGTQLSDGMLIFNTTERSIKVIAAPEDVLVLRPQDQTQICLVAHHLGNWHRSLQLNSDGTLLVEPDSPLVNWLIQHKIGYEKSRLPYHPSMRGSVHD